MAKRMTRKQQREDELLKYTCRDCAKSYDWHSEAYDGHLMLCRCEHHTEGKYSKLLSDRQCAHFVKRENNGKAE